MVDTGCSTYLLHWLSSKIVVGNLEPEEEELAYKLLKSNLILDSRILDILLSINKLLTGSIGTVIPRNTVGTR